MTARGIRNNNPGNIRLGDKWQGLASVQADPSFCTFVSMEYGIRALFKILQTYWRNYQLNSVHSVISRFAPSVENNTKAYEESVSKALGVQPHQKIDLGDRQVMIAIAKAIVRHECGSDANLITPEQWSKGIDLANV